MSLFGPFFLVWGCISHHNGLTKESFFTSIIQNFGFNAFDVFEAYSFKHTRANRDVRQLMILPVIAIFENLIQFCCFFSNSLMLGNKWTAA